MRSSCKTETFRHFLCKNYRNQEDIYNTFCCLKSKYSLKAESWETVEAPLTIPFPASTVNTDRSIEQSGGWVNIPVCQKSTLRFPNICDSLPQTEDEREKQKQWLCLLTQAFLSLSMLAPKLEAFPSTLVISPSLYPCAWLLNHTLAASFQFLAKCQTTKLFWLKLLILLTTENDV